MRKKERGFSFPALMTLMAIFLIILAIARDKGEDKRHADFKTYFGVDGKDSWKDDLATKQIAQPTISKRLTELRNYERLSCEPQTTSVAPSDGLSGGLQEKLNQCETARQILKKATEAAEHFGFAPN